MIPVVKPNSCRSCQASHRDPSGLYCRLNPPATQFVVIPADDEGGVKVTQVTNYPKVQDDWSCHSHKKIAIDLVPERNRHHEI